MLFFFKILFYTFLYFFCKGENLVRKGERIVDQGERQLHSIEEYRSDGKHALRPAVTGRAYVDSIKTLITEGETIVNNGMEIKQKGLEMLAKGFELMPQIPKRRSLKRYFENKVKLAEFQSGVPPEMFEVDDHHDMLGDDDEKNNDDLMVTAELHKTEATADGTEALMRLGGI